MVKNIMAMFIAVGFITACSGGGGSGGGGASTSPSIDTPPSSPIPTAPVNDSSGSGGAGGGSCGLNGSYGMCFNLQTVDSASVRIHTVISGCNRIVSQQTDYTAADCGGEKIYEKTYTLDLTVVGDSSSVAGAKEVDMTLASITQEFFPAAATLSYPEDFLYCDSDTLMSYNSNPKQTKTGSQCYASNPLSLTNHDIIKRTTNGSYQGSSSGCTGYNRECLAGERPTSLSSGGLPVWE